MTRSKTDAFFDGMQGKKLVKIVPFNHPIMAQEMEEVKKELGNRPDEERDIVAVKVTDSCTCCPLALHSGDGAESGLRLSQPGPRIGPVGWMTVEEIRSEASGLRCIIVVRRCMLIIYIQNVMRLAKYEILEDGQYYGEIPGFQGVWAQAGDLETCRDELQSALEDWLILGLRMGHKIPAVAGIQLVPAQA